MGYAGVSKSTLGYVFGYAADLEYVFAFWDTFSHFVIRFCILGYAATLKKYILIIGNRWSFVSRCRKMFAFDATKFGIRIWDTDPDLGYVLGYEFGIRKTFGIRFGIRGFWDTDDQTAAE